MLVSAKSTRYRFGPFVADFRSYELTKHGIRLKLQDQPFQILKLLLQRSGELVSREELRITLWTESTFVDFDAGLNAAIRRLRDVLDDSAESPRYVETVPRHGYRFIAEVETPPEQVAPRAEKNGNTGLETVSSVVAGTAGEPKLTELLPPAVSISRRLQNLWLPSWRVWSYWLFCLDCWQKVGASGFSSVIFAKNSVRCRLTIAESLRRSGAGVLRRRDD